MAVKIWVVLFRVMTSFILVSDYLISDESAGAIFKAELLSTQCNKPEDRN
jgi:hypothetical protein